MKYLCLIYEEEKTLDAMSPSELDGLMGEFRDFTREIRKSGHYLGGEALQPVDTATTVRVRGGKVSTTDGPFAETKELIAGYWLWQVKSMEEAVEWVRRCPDPMPGEEAEIEIRPVFEAEDFGKEFTPELRAKEERLRVEVERQRKS